MVEIIIVKYKNPIYEADTVRQVLNTVNIPHHLTVYENYTNDENLSVVWNRLIERSNAEYICLLNNDTIPNGKWLDLLLEEMKEGVGAVGPISNSAGGHQGGFKEAVKESTIQGCTMLSGFCVVFRKDIWEELGGFDERFKLYGEDSDFFYRMKKAGYKLITNYNAFVYHHGKKSQSIAEDRGKDVQQLRQDASALYQKKIRNED